MAMILTEAQRRVLTQLAKQPAIRVRHGKSVSDWGWRINDDRVSGPLDRLFGKRLVAVEGDRASITPLGLKVLALPPGVRR